jgi:hypothetical protein
VTQTHHGHKEEKQPPEPPEDDMRERAKLLTSEIADLDLELSNLTKNKSAKAKELRSLTRKLVTITLRAK